LIVALDTKRSIPGDRNLVRLARLDVLEDVKRRMDCLLAYFRGWRAAAITEARVLEARRLLYALENATREPGLSDTAPTARYEESWGSNWRTTLEKAERAWKQFPESVPLDAYREDRDFMEQLAKFDKGAR
jgi:hypothetical protein